MIKLFHKKVVNSLSRMHLNIKMAAKPAKDYVHGIVTQLKVYNRIIRG